MKKISPKRYMQGFCIVVLLLAIAREIRPSIAYSAAERAEADSIAAVEDSVALFEDSIARVRQENAERAADSARLAREAVRGDSLRRANASSAKTVPVASLEDPGFRPHRIYSVPGFDQCFPDGNDIQLETAMRLGVRPVADRQEAETRKDELVYVGSNPYFHVDKAQSSIPYLIPSASRLLQDIGSTFFDSLQIKGIPLHKIIVTSVLRTQEDVARLQKHNFNAATNSCHQYATTFDICYNRYKTVEDPEGPGRRAVTNDTLKWVLSEVLDDMRQQGRCHIKYEKKQSCFHITVRE